MKKAFLFAFLLTFTLPGFGQRQKDTSPEAKTPPQKTAKPDSGKNGSNASPTVLRGSSNLEAMLASTLDVRTAKVGDQVLLKTTKNIKQDGEVIIPKGTSLIGRVTEVQRKGRDSAVSKLGLVIDRIQGQGLNQPISASIISIVDTRAMGSVANTAGVDLSGSSNTAATVSRGSAGGSSGGGLLGGVASTVGSTVGGVVNTAASTTDTAVGTVSSTAGSATGALSGTLSGIRITQSAEVSANTSATLSSGERNVRLEKGVTFNLLINGTVDQ